MVFQGFLLPPKATYPKASCLLSAQWPESTWKCNSEEKIATSNSTEQTEQLDG